MNEINGNVFYSFDHLQTILHLKYHAGSQVDRLPQGSGAPSFFHHSSLEAQQSSPGPHIQPSNDSYAMRFAVDLTWILVVCE